MNERPEWPRKSLAEIGELIRGRRFTKKDYVESGLGCIHYAQVHTDFGALAKDPLTFLDDDSRERMRLAHPGDLVIAATSENVDDVGKAVAWLGADDVAVHDDCYIFRHRLDPAYVSYFFTSALFHSQKIKYVSETKVVRISGANLGLIEIPVPPRQVQQQIAEIIGSVDDQITALDTEAVTIGNVLRHFRANSMTEDSANIVRAEEAFRITMGRQRSPQRATGPHMTPYLRSANVGYGTLDLTDVLEMDFNPIEREKFGLRYGDVLVSEGSASETAVGMPAMWRDEIPGPVCFQNTLLRYRAVEGVSIPAFVKHWCLWAYESGQFREVAGGTNIKHIGSKRAVCMPVRLPDIDAQKRIAAELDTMSEVIASIRTEAACLRKVRAGLLSGLLDRTLDIESAELGV